MVPLGGKRDRHDHIGDGEIGLAGFTGIAKYLKAKKIEIPWILETKHDKIEQDIEHLKQIRKQVKL